MGRPRNDPETITQARVQPPPRLSPRMRALWSREFDRFPPGYYLPADVNGMLTYLHTVAEYDEAMARAAAAKKPADRRNERMEVRALRRQLIALQRALRMFPSTRAHPDSARTAALQPTAAASDAGRPDWREMMRASNVKPN